MDNIIPQHPIEVQDNSCKQQERQLLNGTGGIKDHLLGAE